MCKHMCVYILGYVMCVCEYVYMRVCESMRVRMLVSVTCICVCVSMFVCVIRGTADINE